jgi:hypothetical protein
MMKKFPAYVSAGQVFEKNERVKLELLAVSGDSET